MHLFPYMYIYYFFAITDLALKFLKQVSLSLMKYFTQQLKKCSKAFIINKLLIPILGVGMAKLLFLTEQFQNINKIIKTWMYLTHLILG